MLREVQIFPSRHVAISTYVLLFGVIFPGVCRLFHCHQNVKLLFRYPLSSCTRYFWPFLCAHFLFYWKNFSNNSGSYASNQFLVNASLKLILGCAHTLFQRLSESYIYLACYYGRASY